MVNRSSVQAESCVRSALRKAVVVGTLVPLWLSGRALPARGQTVDVTPPIIQSLSFTPTTIDVTGGPLPVTVALHLTDDLAGIGPIGAVVVTFRSTTGVNLTVRPTRVSGTPVDGMYAGNLVVPQFAPSGIWTISSIRLNDLVGNLSNIGTDVLDSRGFPTQLTVVSIPDNDAPTLTGISMLPATVDVSAADQPIILDLQETDALSGVALTSCAPNPNPLIGFVVTLKSPSGAQNRFLDPPAFSLASGNRNNGRWRAVLNMPQYSEAGAWTIQSIVLLDCAGNQVLLGAAQLQSAGLQVTLNVTSNPTDIQPPALTSLSFSPITLNTSTGSQLVTVRLGISDNLSGADVTPTTPTVSFDERGIAFRSPSGQNRSALFFATYTLVSGTPRNGIWESTINFPQFSEDGTWKVDRVLIKDRTRNVSSYTTSALQTLGFPTSLEVIKPSLTSDGTVGAGGGVVRDQTFQDRATVSFPVGALTVPTQVAIDVLTKPLDVPNPTGFTGPGTLFVNIHLTPQPAFPLPFPGLVVILPVQNPMISGTQLTLYKVDVVTGGLIPAVGVFGGPVIGTVNADGLSATFTGIASLSTVVGLVPEALNVGVDIKPGDASNNINLKSRGVLPVAIMGSATFDVTRVSIESLLLAGASPRTKGNGQVISSLEDVDGDGQLDLLVQFDTQSLHLTSNDVEATLTGRTKDGLSIVGRDAIHIVPQ